MGINQFHFLFYLFLITLFSDIYIKCELYILKGATISWDLNVLIDMKQTTVERKFHKLSLYAKIISTKNSISFHYMQKHIISTNAHLHLVLPERLTFIKNNEHFTCAIHILLQCQTCLIWIAAMRLDLNCGFLLTFSPRRFIWQCFYQFFWPQISYSVHS